MSLVVDMSPQKVDFSVHCGDIVARNRVASTHFERQKVHFLELSRHSLPFSSHFEGFSRHSLLKMYR